MCQLWEGTLAPLCAYLKGRPSIMRRIGGLEACLGHFLATRVRFSQYSKPRNTKRWKGRILAV